MHHKPLLLPEEKCSSARRAVKPKPIALPVEKSTSTRAHCNCYSDWSCRRPLDRDRCQTSVPSHSVLHLTSPCHPGSCTCRRESYYTEWWRWL
ncbi:uncharacterized protein LOC124368641 isoform X3 [Homalodisca vitripennis]|uniref:uncharacterized protein LOC124368641 isoform X3 n=1 Tax=Homalodisca vitripennis TaxID=197043 RepID=UPI001EEC1791|nr:uncharacterized protein LOC124368641 isoform X3 [Homalodisca vitripennis]